MKRGGEDETLQFILLKILGYFFLLFFLCFVLLSLSYGDLFLNQDTDADFKLCIIFNEYKDS